MTTKQLTLLNIPTHTPTSQWKLENEDACQHHWKPSLNEYGLICFRCHLCGERKAVDPIKDETIIFKSAQSLKRIFREYYDRFQLAKSPSDKRRFLNAALDRYWRGRIEFLMIGINQPIESEDWERENPCPSELLAHFEILTQEAPLNELGKKSDGEKFDTSESVARGLDAPSNITPSNITPSNKSRRHKGEGSGYLFSKDVTRRGKVYEQWWFQYEETTSEGKRKKRTAYVNKTQIDMIRSLNLNRVPVEQILESLGKKQ